MESVDKCPVQHGKSLSTLQSPPTSTASTTRDVCQKDQAPVSSESTLSTDAPSSCPVQHGSVNSKTVPSVTPVSSSPENECPVQHQGSKSAVVQNSPLAELSQRYNAAANDETFENKRESGAQRVALDTRRQVSAIPKSDHTPSHQPSGESNWVYPSEQQYYNALRRKGYQTREEDVPIVLNIHNAVNEQGWTQIRQWELLRGCENPKLVRFMGRPNDLSPKARFLIFLGYTQPFDRHDWIVDRDGREIRYVIDFYKGTSTLRNPFAMHLDVRPALDSVGALFDRVNRFVREKWWPNSLPKFSNISGLPRK